MESPSRAPSLSERASSLFRTNSASASRYQQAPQQLHDEEEVTDNDRDATTPVIDAKIKYVLLSSATSSDELDGETAHLSPLPLLPLAEIEEEDSDDSISPAIINTTGSTQTSKPSASPIITSKSSGQRSPDSMDVEWRMDADGKLRRFVRRDSVSITSENALHNEDEEIDIDSDSDNDKCTITVPIAISIEAVTNPSTLLATFWSRWAGFAMLAVSAFFFSLMSLFVSLTGGRVNSFFLVWWRCLSQFTIAMIILIIQHYRKRARTVGLLEATMGPKDKRLWIFMRGLVGIVSLSCFYYALTHLPLSEATVLFFTAPIYSGLLGKLVLGESYDKFDTLACAASFIGVVFVARPEFLFGTNSDDGNKTYTTSERTIGVFVALLGAFVSAWVYIFIRKVGKGVNPLILVHYLGWIGVVGAPFALIVDSSWTLPQGQDVAYLLSLCLFAFFGQALFNAGGQKEKAGISSLVRNLDIVFSFFWQLTVEGVSINLLSLLGAAIITSSVVAIGVRKWRKDKQAVIEERRKQVELDEQANAPLELNKKSEER